MNIEIDNTGTAEGLDGIIQKLLQSGSESIVLLSCDQNGFDPSNVDRIMQNAPVPVIGGIFPAIISDKEKMDKGSIAIECSKKNRYYPYSRT